ncbi:hypothetical protein KBD71_05775 [Candidatus Woesebacteria bacterium]|nr:hypothetical protein [Candidatus Woesebacteria bacterium]
MDTALDFNSTENLHLLKKDRALLEKTRIPIVTVAASFRDELARFHGVSDYFGENGPEVLFSRAHYSMAMAAAMGVWKKEVDPKKAWLVDPTNYVSSKDWNTIEFTEEVGKAMARHKILKMLKDFIDTKARNKLPITKAITTPLLYLFEHVQTPILSFHYETGKILAGMGKHVVQVVTDPHVRPQYLDHAELPSMRFCVFDDNTKTSFLELADVLEKKVDPKRVIVTGPPVDPRIVAARKRKSITAHHHRKLRLLITTGGLGNNQEEIEACVRSLSPLVREQLVGGNESGIQLIVYVGVHDDFRERMHGVAKQEGIPTGSKDDESSPLRILYSPHVVQANEYLIKYGFPWADGVITKPSGDMAYDAAAAGCFILTLEPWGEWEHNIRDIFEQHSISRRALPGELEKQLESLLERHGDKSWIDHAIGNALKLPAQFTEGTQNILALLPKTA